ncbi:MAG: TAXI family TRAP transporter solute-binding subunit [Bacillota bacterium]|nr:TAXI family TRAP transporter solute-binding subunit [Bacillota bacterium]
MHKKIIFVIFLLGLVLLTACSQDSNISYINIPTAATTGALYPFGNSLAQLWNANIKNIKANVQGSNGGIDNLNLLEKGEANVSMAVVSNVYQAYHGLDKFQARANKDIRIIAGLYYNPNQVVVTKKSNINSISDIRDKAFAPGVAGSTTEEESSIHLKTAGIQYPDQIKAQFVGFTEAIDLMRNKQIDGAWIMSGAPNSAVSEILKTTDSKLLEIPEDFIEDLKKTYPWYSSYTLKAGVYDELQEDINTSAIKMVMFTHEDMDEEIVYQLTKTFWENLPSLQESHSFLKDLSVEKNLEDIADLPLHKGAEKYYKEIGIID